MGFQDLEYFPREAAPMKDHEIRETVNRVTEVAREFHGAQQLRERVRHVLRPLIEAVQGGRTGWPPGMLQDDDRKLHRWFASQPGARRQARDAAAAAVVDHGLTSTPVADQKPPNVSHNADAALHDGALAALSILMDGDPAIDTPLGAALVRLADAIEAYERATLPPPFGDAPPPAIDPRFAAAHYQDGRDLL